MMFRPVSSSVVRDDPLPKNSRRYILPGLSPTSAAVQSLTGFFYDLFTLLELDGSSRCYSGGQETAAAATRLPFFYPASLKLTRSRPHRWAKRETFFVLTGHGPFLSYLHRFELSGSVRCTCDGPLPDRFAFLDPHALTPLGRPRLPGAVSQIKPPPNRTDFHLLRNSCSRFGRDKPRLYSTALIFVFRR